MTFHQKQLRSALALHFPSIAFYGLLVLNIVSILSLDSFPSNDGPVHLYYADVVADLLTGGKTYGEHFAIRHLFPPYSSQTYLLIALNGIFHPLVSEKILVSLCVLLLCGGFRYFVNGVSRTPGVVPLLVFPFALHKFVFLGIYNFSLSIGVTLILCGLWVRHDARWSLRASGVLVLLALILLGTHPVGVLVALLFSAVHLTASLLKASARLDGRGWISALRLSVKRRRSEFIHLAFFGACLVYVGMFMPGGMGKTYVFDLGYSANQLRKFLLMGPISPFQVWYYAAPLGIVVGATLLFLWPSGRQRDPARPMEHGYACLAAAAACLLAYLVLPSEEGNGPAYVDQRFPIFAVLFCLVASACNTRSRAFHLVAGTALVVICTSLLAYQSYQCHRLDRELAVLQTAPVVREGTIGAIIMDGERKVAPYAFSPYYWSSAHYFRRSKAVLVNAPWLDLPFIMLTTVQRHPLPNRGPDRLADSMPKINWAKPERVQLLVAPAPEKQATPSRVPGIAQDMGLQRFPWSDRRFAFYGDWEAVLGTQPSGLPNQSPTSKNRTLRSLWP